jgi:hypothetical protein
VCLLRLPILLVIKRIFGFAKTIAPLSCTVAESNQSIDQEDPMAALRKVSAERLQGNNQTPMSPQ